MEVLFQDLSGETDERYWKMSSLSDLDLKRGLSKYKVGIRFHVESETLSSAGRPARPASHMVRTQASLSAIVNRLACETDDAWISTTFPVTSSCPDAHHFKDES